MASILQKILKKPPYTRTITALLNPHAPNLAPPGPFFPPYLIEPKPDHHCAGDPSPSLIHPKTGHLNSSHSFLIFPNWPFGLSLDPIISNGLVPVEGDDVNSGESRAMWADSVKKKRKKKMNKHKYKKLRKRLRRKT